MMDFPGVGGYSYLYEPLWWIGITASNWVEIANFAARFYQLSERLMVCSDAVLHTSSSEGFYCIFWSFWLYMCHGFHHNCFTCSPRREIQSVVEVWDLATEPGFVFYMVCWLCRSCYLYSIMPPMVRHISCSILVFVKLVGSIVDYLNKALDTFNTAVVSPIYYVMFTSFTILASVIMFKDWDRQNPTQIITEMCGFVTILSGTFLLHKTKDMADSPTSPIRLPKHGDEEDGFGQEGTPLRRQAKHADDENNFGQEGIPLRRQDTMK
ncbi:hypothetical protein Leryth_024308 [Lithospermum erythrorhizon]|nr:hypothetical protein Leryth_024308 [Lithospermum erythrorhizon]